jgi:hypothetical protein
VFESNEYGGAAFAHEIDCPEGPVFLKLYGFGLSLADLAVLLRDLGYDVRSGWSESINPSSGGTTWRVVPRTAYLGDTEPPRVLVVAAKEPAEDDVVREIHES